MNNFEGRVNTTRFDLLRKTEVRSEINQPLFSLIYFNKRKPITLYQSLNMVA